MSPETALNLIIHFEIIVCFRQFKLYTTDTIITKEIEVMKYIVGYEVALVIQPVISTVLIWIMVPWLASWPCLGFRYYNSADILAARCSILIIRWILYHNMKNIIEEIGFFSLYDKLQLISRKVFGFFKSFNISSPSY